MLCFEAFSFFIFKIKPFYDLENYFFILFILLLIFFTLKNPRYGIYLAGAELIVGSQGHLLELTLPFGVLSLRMVIFILVMICSISKAIYQKKINETTFFLRKNFWLSCFACVVVFSLLQAIIKHNEIPNIYADFNNWLYALYLFPMLFYLKNKEDWEVLKKIFIAGTLLIIIKTMFFLFVFSHDLSFGGDIYTWGRTTLWGEFTRIANGSYRIFSQSQIFCLLAFVIFLAQSLKQQKLAKNTFILTALNFFVVITSLSRSFWLAALFMTGLLFIFNFDKKILLKQIFYILSPLAVAILLFLSVVNFPVKGSNEIKGFEMINSRFANEAAVSSRWNQLPILIDGIRQAPLLGHGFGFNITYKSSDPRIKNEKNPEGYYTTYAFEWGFLDFALKFGFLGLFVYLIFILKKIYIILFKRQTKKDFQSNPFLIALTLMILTLIFVHATTPYLNHPLGLGVVISFLVVFNIVQEEHYQIENNRS